MATDPAALPPAALDMLRARHLATLTTLRSDGSPHVVPVGFSWDPEALLVRVITNRASQKVRNAARGDRAAVSQVDGRHWITLEGPSRVVTDADTVADAVQRYAERYREPRPNPERVVIVIEVDRAMGNW
ncbi:MAG: PPOX class F420-dependent oxidoreductase [Nakamurella sp.]